MGGSPEGSGMVGRLLGNVKGGIEICGRPVGAVWPLGAATGGGAAVGSGWIAGSAVGFT